jgi:hypothetical protein
MSFLKIKDPAERDRIVEQFMKTKRNIQQSYLSEKLGDIGQQQELMKLYKPIIDSQSGIAKELGSIKENTIATTNALKALPASSLKAIQFPFAQYPSIEADDNDPVKDDGTVFYGDIAVPYLQRYLSKKQRKLTDTTFGISSDDEGKKFYIGGTPVDIKENDITVLGTTYSGTKGLWELLTLKQPTIYDENDLNNYGDILFATKAIYQNPNNPKKVKSVPGPKYADIIKLIWEAKKGKVGEGIIVLPHDPNALVEMLSLRLASFQAGNTGVRNEIVGICDELLRQNVITNESYKNLMLQL